MHMTVIRTVHMSHTRNGMNMHDTQIMKRTFSVTLIRTTRCIEHENWPSSSWEGL